MGLGSDFRYALRMMRQRPGMTGVGLVASYVPARRAAGMDLVAALRR